MTTPSTPLNAETAYVIAAVCLFSTNHWIGCAICVALAYYTATTDRKARERANLPSDEIGARSDLPSIQAPAAPEAGSAAANPPDPWKPDSST